MSPIFDGFLRLVSSSGDLYLNSTPGTRFFFDTDLPEVKEFVSSLGGPLSQVFPCVDTLEGIKKKELFSIEDPNTFINKSNEQGSTIFTLIPLSINWSWFQNVHRVCNDILHVRYVQHAHVTVLILYPRHM
ncbi:Uncharacterized protein Rs2_21713 [Raphanus sativus]|nr:Uncharacterized protein Rs2_21713 [Raphanus sativus]